MKFCFEKKIALSVFLLACPFLAGAKNKKHIYIQDRREMALNVCLSENYAKLGAYNSDKAKDYSLWTYSYYLDYKFTLDGETAFHDFIEKNTGNFYKENLAIKVETNPPPYNAIFARCMTFYDSQKLRNFLLRSTP